MSLLEQASLILTPNGFKESKLYSVVPSDGAGDMTVVRATTATRVNESGLIETVPKNLLPYSVDYSQANWIKTTVTLTSNFATAPDGTTTASKIVATGSDSLLQDIINITSGITYTFSVYLKTTSGTLNTNISLGSPAFPDTEGDGGRTKQIIVTNTWQRFTITSTADATADSGISVGGFSSFSTGEEVLVWGAQLEAGSYPTSYIPTVASTVTRNADVISKTGISSLIGQTEGTWYYEGIINNTNSEFQILTSERNVSNTIAITRQTLNRVRARIWSNSTLSIDIVSGSNVFLNTKSKIALSYVSGNVNLFYNGILVASSTNSFAFSSNVGTIELSVMVDYFGSSLNTNNMDSVLIFKTALTDAECIALTTL